MEKRERENIWNVPNILTMLRIAMIFLFVWQFVMGRHIAAMVIFVLAGVTDFLDGYIARKQGLVTNFGKLMDPLADKLMLLTALVCLTVAGLVPRWLVIVELVKEAFMIIGGFYMLRRGIVVQAKMIGKVATVAFIFAVVATFLHEYTAPWDFYLQVAAVTLSIAAMLWYLVEGIRALRQGK